MNKLIKILFLLSLIFGATTVYSQESADNSVKATNFSVPSSVAFNLLDINPSQVHRPGFSRDFKFDWLVKNNQIISNIAVEMQPLWLFAYKNTDYAKLVEKKYLGQILSSLTISVGTTSKDSTRSLAWGAKINLYAKKNPIYDIDYIKKVGQFFTNSTIENEIFRIETAYRLEDNEVKKRKYLNQIDSLKKMYEGQLDKHFKSIDEFKKQYEKDNWNTTIVDLGFGKIYNYLSESIDSLAFNNQGGGIWVSGYFGIGKKWLVNKMIKYTKIAGNEVTTIGANFRYGGLNSNFFIEGIYNISSKDNLKKITIAYGGDIKFKTFALQFGLRTDYTKDFQFKNLVPLVNLNYLLN